MSDRREWGGAGCLGTVSGTMSTITRCVAGARVKVCETPQTSRSAVKGDLWLFYYVGFTSTTDSWKLNNTDQFSYPLISSYNEYPTTSTSYSLAYGLEVSTSGNTPTETMSGEFWKADLSRFDSSKSRGVYLIWV